jgi:O-methyltransferase
MKKILASLGLRDRVLGRPAKIRYPVECDAEDRKMLEHVVSRGLSMASHERLFTTLMACRHVCDTGVDGDFVECGVWKGGNALLAADLFRRRGETRSTWLFDTFAGMTEPTDVDVNPGGNKASATFLEKKRTDHNAWCYASLEEVAAIFDALGLRSRTRFVKGDVLSTLDDSASLPTAVSVLRLDTDWYESTRKELEVLYPRLSVGGVLIIDDYGHWGGARKAVDEYFAKVPRPFLQYTDPTGRVGVKLE